MNHENDSMWGIIHGDEVVPVSKPSTVSTRDQSKVQNQKKDLNINSRNSHQTNQNINSRNSHPNSEQNHSQKKLPMSSHSNPQTKAPNLSTNHQHPLSKEDIKRKEIADENYKFIKAHPEYISKHAYTIYDDYHNKINETLKKTKIKSRFEDIIINNFSTIGSAIYYHKHGYKNIYILNFADSKKPGGGYLNGRNAQEECLCRQTLLYPTIDKNKMYIDNQKCGPEGSDIMIYSPDVLVIRDDKYTKLNPHEFFTVNIISSAAVDNRSNVKGVDKIMEIRIRKIINLAAENSLKEKEKSKNVLILGAFGCGVFNNDPKLISSLFAKVLLGEGLKNYFNLIVFPIYKGSNEMTQEFQKALKPNGKNH